MLQFANVCVWVYIDAFYSRHNEHESKRKRKNNAHNSFHEQNKIDLFNFERFFRCTPCTHTHKIFSPKKANPKQRKRSKWEWRRETHQNSHVFIKHFHFGLPARVPMYGCAYNQTWVSLSLSVSVVACSYYIVLCCKCECMLRSEAATWFVWHWLKTVDICTPRETAEYCCLLRRSYFLFSFQSFTSFVLYQQFFGRVFILVIFIVNFFDRQINNFFPSHNCIELVTNCTWKIEEKRFVFDFCPKKLFFFLFQPKSKKKEDWETNWIVWVSVRVK